MTAASTPSLAQLVNRASRALARNGDAALKPPGLRYAQVPVLALLGEGAELTQKALAEAAGIEQPSMAQLLTRMDRDGLIRRVPHPSDARSHTIAMAAGNTARLAQARQQLADLDRRAVTGFTAQEIDSLKDLLTRLSSNLEKS